jgi:hypothetical protein
MNPLSHNAALQDRWEKEMPLQETLYNLSDVLSGAVHTYRSVLSNLSEVCAPTLSSGSSSGSDESTASIECFRAGSSGSDESTASIECCRAVGIPKEFLMEVLHSLDHPGSLQTPAVTIPPCPGQTLLKNSPINLRKL